MNCGQRNFFDGIVVSVYRSEFKLLFIPGPCTTLHGHITVLNLKLLSTISFVRLDFISSLLYYIFNRDLGDF